MAAARVLWYDEAMRLVVRLSGHGPDVRRWASEHTLGIDPKRPRKKPPEAGIAVPAIPPRGPLPLQGGAEAPLEFDRD